MGGDQTLNIIIKAKDQASESLNKIKGSVEKMQPAFRKMAAVGTAAFVGIAAVAYKSINAYAEVERANRQLEHAIIGVSKGTLAQVESVKKITAALEKKAGVDADALNMGVAQLSTFGLQSKSVIDLTKSLADLTVNQSGLNATSDDYISSANIMAKAMRGEFGALQKMGIRFTEHQQELIKTGTETQKVSALQEGLAQNLRETTDTVAGLDLAQAKLKRTMENIQENLGKALAPAFAKAAEAIAPLIEKFADWAERNPELLSKIILIGGAVAALTAGVGLLGMALPAIITGFALLTGPIGLAMVAIGSLTFALSKANEMMQWTKEDWQMTWTGLKMMFKDGVNFLIGLAEGWANMWVGAVNTILKALNKIQISIPDWVPKIGGNSFGINLPLASEIKLPRMEHGGTVQGAVGTEVPIMAHGGETVIPAGQSRNNGNYINVNIYNPEIKDRDDIDLIRRQVESAFRDVIRINKLQF